VTVWPAQGNAWRQRLSSEEPNQEAREVERMPPDRSSRSYGVLLREHEWRVREGLAMTSRSGSVSAWTCGKSRGRIRRVVWPAMREQGSTSPPAGPHAATSRTACRHHEDAVDVINFQSYSASLADAGAARRSRSRSSSACGCPVNSSRECSSRTPRDGRGPAEWECGKRLHLTKPLDQPWFQPFATRGSSRWLRALRIHREG
jgi:hypothetical protein